VFRLRFLFAFSRQVLTCDPVGAENYHAPMDQRAGLDTVSCRLYSHCPFDLQAMKGVFLDRRGKSPPQQKSWGGMR